MLAAITVDSLLDNFDPDAPTTDNVVTLREAIIAANTNMVAGDAPAGDPGADTIDFSVSGTIDIGSQLPAIIDAVTIDGGGQITIDAGNGPDGVFKTGDGYRIFEIDDGTSSEIDVTLSDLTLTGGDIDYRYSNMNGGAVFNTEYLTITGSTISGNSSGNPSTNRGVGGGVFNGGTVTVTDSTITGNVAGRGGGGTYNAFGGTANFNSSSIYGNAVRRFDRGGGGIHNAGSATITDSSISGNTADRGGGVYNSGVVSILSSTVSDNDRSSATNAGGGIFSYGTMQITATTISNNGGGGITSLGGHAMATITDSTITNNTGIGVGLNSGAAIVVGSTISDNVGGGVNIYGTTAHITSSQISGNTESQRGGGVYNRSGIVTVTDSIISGNSTRFRGGGIFNWDFGGTLTVTGSTISGNSVSDGGGGGIYNGNIATASITGSTISGNTANDDGGGVLDKGGFSTTITRSTISRNSASGSGGGIYAGGQTNVITNSTISGNVAGGSGGGIAGSRMTLTYSTINGNSADFGGGVFIGGSGTTISNSILAGSLLGGDIRSSFFFTGSHNLIEDGSGELPDTISGDPLLGPLGDNGGPTQTHALLPGSPALDAGSGPIASYQFDEASSAGGQTSVDTMGSFSGTYQGDVALVTPSAPVLTGSAADFDNNPDNFIEVLPPGTLSNSGLPIDALTLEAWVKLDSYVNMGGIVTAVKDNAAEEAGWALETREGGKFGFFLRTDRSGEGNDADFTLETTNSFSTDQWYHVVATYDGLRYSKIYVDGVEQASVAQRGSIVYPTSGDGGLVIGKFRDSNDNIALDGKVDGLSIYDRALTPGEILEHATKGFLDQRGFQRFIDSDGTPGARPDIGAYESQGVPNGFPAGDYNEDGIASLADYVLWRNTLGSTTDLRANGNDTGDSENVIDQADYTFWKTNFGNTVVPVTPAPMATTASEAAFAAFASPDPEAVSEDSVTQSSSAVAANAGNASLLLLPRDEAGGAKPQATEPIRSHKGRHTGEHSSILDESLVGVFDNWF